MKGAEHSFCDCYAKFNCNLLFLYVYSEVWMFSDFFDIYNLFLNRSINIFHNNSATPGDIVGFSFLTKCFLVSHENRWQPDVFCGVFFYKLQFNHVLNT